MSYPPNPGGVVKVQWPPGSGRKALSQESNSLDRKNELGAWCVKTETAGNCMFLAAHVSGRELAATPLQCGLSCKPPASAVGY